MCNQQLDESTSFTKHPVFTYDESVCLDVRFVWMSGFVWMASMFRTNRCVGYILSDNPVARKRGSRKGREVDIITVVCQKSHVVCFLQDPRALNSRTCAFPESNTGFTTVPHKILRIWTWDLRLSICFVCESNLREVTVISYTGFTMISTTYVSNNHNTSMNCQLHM